MERRALKRMPAGITIKLFYRSAFYTGIVTDLSEKDMFISTIKCPPFDAMLVITFHLQNQFIKVIARVRRTAEKRSDFNGIGVEILNSTQNYLKQVNAMRSAKS